MGTLEPESEEKGDKQELMKDILKVNYTDFWPTFDMKDNFFHHLLSKKYELVISDEPDLLIYSLFGKEDLGGKGHMHYKCKKLFYSGENWGPDFSQCDYAFTGDILPDPRHYRLPYFVICYPPERYVKPEIDPEAVLASKHKFCNFMVSNPVGKVRNRFFERLSKYKHIDSGGKYRNNVGGRVENKANFIKDHKFSLAFENSSYPGYSTEKIVEAFFANSLPIYWGNPLIHEDFNPDAFLNYHAFPSEKQFIEYIKEVDNNDELYLQHLRAPWCHNNHLNSEFMPENILAWLIKIVETPITPIACKPRTITHVIDHNIFRIKKKFRRGRW